MKHINSSQHAVLLAAALALVWQTSVHGAALATDDAANYDNVLNPWTDGSNEGTGFGAWTFATGAPGTAFWYLGDSSTNGGGGSGINTGGQAWGMSIGGNVMDAVRPFTVGGPNSSSSLAVGQGVELAFDNGWIPTGGVVGFNLRSGSESRFEFYFTGGGLNYSVVGSTLQSTTAGFTDAGMNLTFTLTGTDTFSFTVDFLGGGSEVFSGSLGGTAGSGIDNIRLFNFNGGYGATNNQFFNSLSVVPEPSVGLLFGAGALALAFLRRRFRGEGSRVRRD